MAPSRSIGDASTFLPGSFLLKLRLLTDLRSVHISQMFSVFFFVKKTKKNTENIWGKRYLS